MFSHSVEWREATTAEWTAASTRAESVSNMQSDEALQDGDACRTPLN